MVVAPYLVLLSCANLIDSLLLHMLSVVLHMLFICPRHMTEFTRYVFWTVGRFITGRFSSLNGNQVMGRYSSYGIN